MTGNEILNKVRDEARPLAVYDTVTHDVAPGVFLITQLSTDEPAAYVVNMRNGAEGWETIDRLTRIVLPRTS